MSTSFLQFWGKAKPDTDGAYPEWHPVAYHCLDVAACVEAMLEARPRYLVHAQSLLGVADTDAVRTLLVALAGLHDIGKYAPAFQSKVPMAWPDALGALDVQRIVPGAHTEDGLILWSGKIARSLAERLWPGARPALNVLAPAVFGHHGRPVAAGTKVVGERFGVAGTAASLEYIDALIALVSPTPLSSTPLDVDAARIASWWVAGLLTICDWIGSGQAHFRYTAPDGSDATLAGYWGIARQRARTAVRDAGLVSPSVAPLRSFGELFDRELSPTPAQSWAMGTPLPAGPALFILEDVTGAGKTEAAHALVHRLMVDERASGAYWAMPTQATANAMYARQASVFERLYTPAPDARPSLVLAHGQQQLHTEFRQSVYRPDVLGGVYTPGQDVEGPEGDADLPSTAACAAFLADDRRAALLADVGAGTVDQALLGILPSRYNALRLFALSDRVLVVDEAHAYDAYMRVELEALLRFQAALGGSAIVLSATLPAQQRTALVGAWAEGLRYSGVSVAAESPTATDYPLATSVGCDGVREDRVKAASWSHRRVQVRLISAVADAIAHLRAAVDRDGLRRLDSEHRQRLSRGR